MGRASRAQSHRQWRLLRRRRRRGALENKEQKNECEHMTHMDERLVLLTLGLAGRWSSHDGRWNGQVAKETILNPLLPRQSSADRLLNARRLYAACSLVYLLLLPDHHLPCCPTPLPAKIRRSSHPRCGHLSEADRSLYCQSFLVSRLPASLSSVHCSTEPGAQRGW